MRLERAVQNAVTAADRVILDESDGVEETAYLTAAVSRSFAEKMLIHERTQMLAGDMLAMLEEEDEHGDDVDGAGSGDADPAR